MLAVARLIHPFPTLLNVAATAGLAFVASNGDPGASLLARMLLVMLFAQSAIGITNDVFDRELDAAAKPWKPLVAGAASLRFAIVLALACIAATAAVAVTLGAAAFALAMLGLACGLAYDARLKRSVLSAVPYMIAIPTLPLWVWATVGEWERVLWWMLPLGALMGLTLHLANTLPDIASDAAHGVRGMAHALGARWSRIVAWCAYSAALVVAVAIALISGYDAITLWPAILLAMACVIVSVAAWRIRRDDLALQIGFGALGIGAATASVGWLAAVT